MLNEQDKIKTQIMKKEKEIEKLKEDSSNIKNKSMTTEERLNELDAIYEVSITFIIHHCLIKKTESFYLIIIIICFVLESKIYSKPICN